ncbi:MAG: sigma-70 family RNA polymerase sigma factor [Planctomycetes bacterium]|nr:sigma-70 family RNA polymerase sigma factor [Planctomycetota bacterium]
MGRKEHGTTQQLVLKIKEGDREAFDQLFMRYYPRIKLVVRMQMLDKLRAQVEADDVIQEIYMEVYKNFHKFQYSDPDSFFKWVTTVVGWKIKDFDKYFFKTAKRQPHESSAQSSQVDDSSGFDLTDRVPAAQNTPSQIVMEREGYQVLQQALEKLPEKDRKVIAYRQIMKLSAAETGELLNMQANAVNVLFHRAQQRLEKVLKEMAYFG